MEEKTMMLGDREYVVRNKAEEAILNKWKKVLEKSEKNINFKVDEITDMKFVNTDTGETIKSYGFHEIQTESKIDEWKDNYLLEAIITACDYNCLIEEIITWKDKVQQRYDKISTKPQSQEQFIYMLCVLLFGDYGCSPRTGWIEDVEGFHNFIDKFIEHYKEYEEYGRYEE